MREAASTPTLALRRLTEMSAEVEAAILLDAQGEPVAAELDDHVDGERMRELVATVLEHAGGRSEIVPAEIEVVTSGGAVFVARRENLALAAVTGRLALSSLVRYDLMMTLAEIDADRL